MTALHFCRTAAVRFALRSALRSALTFASLTPMAAFAGTDADAIRQLVDATIRPLMAEHDVPGMAVAITVDGQQRFFNYGVASRETQSGVSEATLFELGSVSKTFTATLAAYAQATGKLSLDDHPSKYMPPLRGRPLDRASLLHLGTYTAGGLPLQFPDQVADDDRAMLAYFRQWKPDASPGAKRRYSNPSIGLLGHVTALALKSDFAEAIEKQVFPAFGLRHSHIHVPDDEMGHYAWGYDDANKPKRVRPGLFADESYGVKSSASDMIRFVQAQLDPSALEAPMRRAVEATQVGHYKVGAMAQGLGWEQYAWPVTQAQLLAGNSAGIIFDANDAVRIDPKAPTAPALFNKTGSTGGFGAYVAFVPARRIGIVMLANKNYPIPARVKAAYAILDRLAMNANPPLR